MDKLEIENGKSVYGKNGVPEFITVSMGVAYKLNEDPLYMVKIPVENGVPQSEEAVMIDGSSDGKYEEFPDEFVPREALEDGVQWFRSLDKF
jgi:hypothetical protein